jgi:hypothetical protein
MSHLNDDEIDAILREVGDADVPEPSPLFWDHFASRVNAAIDAPAGGRPWWQLPASLAWSAAAIVFVVAVLGLYMVRPAHAPARESVPTAQEANRDVDATVVPATETDIVDMESDEAWAIVRSFADELAYDDAREAGVVPSAGAIEHEAAALSAAERAELVRLIENDLKRTGA